MSIIFSKLLFDIFLGIQFLSVIFLVPMISLEFEIYKLNIQEKSEYPWKNPFSFDR